MRLTRLPCLGNCPQTSNSVWEAGTLNFTVDWELPAWQLCFDVAFCRCAWYHPTAVKLMMELQAPSRAARHSFCCASKMLHAIIMACLRSLYESVPMQTCVRLRLLRQICTSSISSRCIWHHGSIICSDMQSLVAGVTQVFRNLNPTHYWCAHCTRAVSQVITSHLHQIRRFTTQLYWRVQDTAFKNNTPNMQE